MLTFDLSVLKSMFARVKLEKSMQERVWLRIYLSSWLTMLGIGGWVCRGSRKSGNG